MYLKRRLWLTTSFCALGAASSTRYSPSRRHPHSSNNILIGETPGFVKDNNHEENHISPSSRENPTLRGQKNEGKESMIIAEKKAYAQRDSRNDHVAASFISSQQQSPPVMSPPFVAPFVTVLGLASAPLSALKSEFTPPVSASVSSQPTGQDQALSDARNIAQSASSAPSPSQTASSHSSSSMPLPPALLAIVLLFACLLFLMILFAARRMCGRKRSRARLTSPLFLGAATSIGSEHHRSEAIRLEMPKMVARDTALRYDHISPGGIRTDGKVDPYQDVGSLPEGKTFSVVLDDAPDIPVPVHIADASRHSPRSRILRPYAARAYHRPHPAYTADPESVMPLIPRESPTATGNSGASIKGKSPQMSARAKEKGKENARPVPAIGKGRRRRDTLASTSQLLSTHSLASVGSNAEIPMTLSQAYTNTSLKPDFSSSSSLGSSKQNHVKVEVAHQLPSANTALDIGLAMMRDLSSPNVGLGLDLNPKASSLHPPLPSKEQTSQTTGGNIKPDGSLAVPVPSKDSSEPLLSSAETVDSTEEGTLPYLPESTSSVNKGLAYLSSRSSRGLIVPQKEEQDIAKTDHGTAPVLAVEKGEASNPYGAQEVQTSSSASDVDENMTTPPDVQASAAGPFKAPILPTLSEMALSRADPLYESVTNELFSSYGVRMSTASGTGRMSRVSARISRMLSWFGDAGAENRVSGVGDKLSVEDWMSDSGDRRPGVAAGGVQPLRIGKLQKSPE